MTQTFGENLRKLRNEFGISQTELARAVDMRPENINHYEAGRRVPNIVHLRDIAKAINQPIECLVCDVEFPSDTRFEKEILT